MGPNAYILQCTSSQLTFSQTFNNNDVKRMDYAKEINLITIFFRSHTIMNNN